VQGVESNSAAQITSPRSKSEVNDLHTMNMTKKSKHLVVGTENTESSNLHKAKRLDNSESQSTNIRTIQHRTSHLTTNSKNLSSISKIEFKEIPRFKIFYANVHNRQRGLPKSRILLLLLTDSLSNAFFVFYFKGRT
jgi:Ulp1 family protease